MDSRTPSLSAPGREAQTGRDLRRLSLGALGVVFGDIGTSPLYAVRECFLAHPGEPGAAAGAEGLTTFLPVTTASVLGVLSLVFWSLTLVVAVKYLVFVLRADNRGEGGILALLALLIPQGTDPRASLRRYAVTMLGLFGAALLFADGAITPAISVLSAVEGLKVATPVFTPWVLPITAAILVGLFLVQRHGTATIARWFGPLMLVWFVMLAALGLPWILRQPTVLLALSPHCALAFFGAHPEQTLVLLGYIVLCITGSEALYADMGHFGKSPIRRAWFVVVFPALLVNYFGQGALLLATASGLPAASQPTSPAAAAALANPFYALAPGWFLYPAVIVATIATIIASQALISGAFSLAHQAVQLGYSPRLSVIHTSTRVAGQIYVPEINHILMVVCLFLVVVFRTSSNLADAYGIAVMGTMITTTLLLAPVAVRNWGWSWTRAGILAGAILAIEVPFLCGTLTKFWPFGVFPILMGLGVFVVMTTWYRGRDLLDRIDEAVPGPTMAEFLADLARQKPPRVEGTAVILAEQPGEVPPLLLHHYRHSRALHQRVVLLDVRTVPVPRTRPEERLTVRDLGQGFYEVRAVHGFTEDPDVPDALLACARRGLEIDPLAVSYYVWRSRLLPTGPGRMMRWRKRLFGFLQHNERPASAFYGIPVNRVVELGRQVEF